MPDKIKDIYDLLKREGAEVGDEKQFREFMEDDASRRQVHADLTEVGEVNQPYEAWSNSLGYGQQQPQGNSYGTVTEEEFNRITGRDGSQQQPAGTPPVEAARQDTTQPGNIADVTRQQVAEQVNTPSPQDVKDAQDFAVYDAYNQAYANAKEGGQSAFGAARDVAATQEYDGDGSNLNDRILGRAYAAERRVMNEKAGKLAVDMVKQMGDRSLDRREDLRNIYYSPEVREAIEDMRVRSGISDYRVLMDEYVKPQLKRVIQTRFNLDDAQANSIVSGIASTKEQTQEIADEREEYSTVQQFLSPIVEHYLADNDEKVAGMLYDTDKTLAKGGNPDQKFGEWLGQKLGNKIINLKEKDAEKVWQGLKQQVDDIKSDLLGNQEFMAYMDKQAQKHDAGNGILYYYGAIVPSLAERVEQKFMETEVARNMPKGTLDYILGKFHDSVTGMLLDIATKSERQRQVESEGRQMTAMGQNPDVKPEWWMDVVGTIPEMAPDFWLYALGGNLGGKAAQGIMMERIAQFASEKGVSKAVAANMIKEAAARSLPKRLVQNLDTQMTQMGIMMGTADATRGTVSGLYQGKDFGESLEQGFEEGVKGAGKGAVLGAAIGVGNAATATLTNWRKVLGKTLAFMGEGGTMYGQELADLYSSGEDLPDNLVTGYLQTLMNLGMIKKFGDPRHTVKGAWEAGKRLATEPDKYVGDLYGKPSVQGILTDKEIGIIREKTGSDDIEAAVDVLRVPFALKTKEEQADAIEREQVFPHRLTKEEREAEKAYVEVVTDKDITQDSRERIATLLGGVAPVIKPVRVRVDGSTMRTYGIDGHLVEEKVFPSADDAWEYAGKGEEERDKNASDEQARVINDIDSEKSFGDYMDEQFLSARKKYAEAIKDPESQGEQGSKVELTEDEQAAMDIVANKDLLSSAARKRSAGEQLTEDEAGAVAKYLTAFGKYVRSGKAYASYLREYEADHDMEPGELENALKKTPSERSLEEQFKVEDYRRDTQEHIDERRGIQSVAEKAEEAHDDGYAIEDAGEMNDAKNALEIARERLSSVVGDDSMPGFEENPVAAIQYMKENGGWTDEQMQAALDYLQARSRFDGIIEHVRDDVEQQVRQVRQTINGRVHQEDSLLHPAAMKGNDPNNPDAPGRQVYVISGKVKTSDNGTVDVGNSTKDLLVVDAETGKPEWITVDELHHADTPIDPQKELAEAEETTRLEVSKQAADKIDGVLPFAPDDVYKVKDGDGALHDVRVVQDNGDGTIMVSIDNGEPMPTTRENIQEMYDRSNMDNTRDKMGLNKKQATDNQQTTDQQTTDQQAQQTETPPAASTQQPAVTASEPQEGTATPKVENVPETTGEPVTEPATDAMPMVGEGEDAEPDFLKTTPQRGHAYLYKEAGLDPTEADDFVSAKMAAADKELERVKAKKPKVGVSLSKYRKEKAAWEQQLEGLQQVSQYWHDVQGEREKVVAQEQQEIAAREAALAEERRKKEAADAAWERQFEYPDTESGDERAKRETYVMNGRSYEDKLERARRTYGDAFREPNPDEATDVLEWVTQNLPKGGLLLNGYKLNGGHKVRGLSNELGWSNKGVGGDASGYSYYLGNRETGGKSVDEVAHDLWEGSPMDSAGNHVWDTSDIKNAILEAFSLPGGAKGIREYALRNRIAEAESVTSEIERGTADHVILDYAKEYRVEPEEVESLFDMLRADKPEQLSEEQESAINSWAEERQHEADSMVSDYDLMMEEINREEAEGRQPERTAEGNNGKGLNNEINNGTEQNNGSRGMGSEPVAPGNEQPVEAGGDRMPRQGDEGHGERTVPQEPGQGGLPPSPGMGAPGDAVAGGTQGRIAHAEEETNPAPTEAQKKAGNYKKGHVRIDGYDISIENPKGSERSGKDASGNPWSVTMQNSYGYIRGTEGVDGDHIDVFLSDHVDDWDGTVYVVDQVKEDGSFDEHKVMYGFNSAEEAREAYLSNYSPGWKGLGTITGVSKEEFKKWTDSSHRKTKPFAEYKSVKVEEGQSGVVDGIDTWQQNNNPHLQKADGRPSDLSAADVEVRDGLVEIKREGGIEVSLDDVEGQRVLDEDREHQARMMGSKTNRKKSKIATDLADVELSKEQQDVVDIFTGKKNRVRSVFVRNNGEKVDIEFQQGNEGDAGSKHSLYRHYGTNSDYYTSEEILLIPEIIRSGKRNDTIIKKSGKPGFLYQIEKDGIRYTVLTEKKGGKELFNNFYTDRKNTSNDDVNAKGDTGLTARSSEESVSGANIRQNSETGKETSEISQGFGSAATSLNQIPSGMKKVNWQSGTTNVDIGGGRFDTATEYLREQGVENLVFDPFNRNAEHNKEVAERVRDNKVDTATCHNVLNVIDSELSRANVILQAAKAIKPDGTAYFTVYEGDKSGVGRQTKSDSRQNNRPTKDYVREIEAYFDDVKVKNNVIVASKPKAVAEKSVWDFDGEYKGNDLRFFRTSSGEAYGFVKDGKMYIDPRIATSETPVHEYHHLWAEALEKANPEAWGKLKSELFGNKDLEAYVRELYPEIADENELAHEMFAQFGGKRGAERLRAEEERMMSEAEDGVFGKARIKAMFNTLRQVLSKYWQMARDLFSGDNSRLKDMKLEDFADMAMGDLLRGHKPESERFNPGNKDIRYQFIGERGSSQADSSEERSYRMDNLEVARRMEKEGKEAKSIKLATGWERGADGKWRYEIGETPMNNVIKALRKSVEKGDREVSRLRDEADRLRDRAYRLDTRIPKRLDSRYSEEQKAKYREMRKERDRLYDEAEKKVEEAYELRDKIEAEGWSTTLGDVLGEDSELLRAYPSLASVKVVLKDRLEGAEGSFNSESHTIKLAVSDKSGKDLYKTLVHEVQHAVQHEEGFALGGNIRSITDMENRETAMEALRRDIPRMRLEEKELSTLLEDNERIRRMAEEKGIPSRTQWRMIELKLDNLRDEKVLAEKLLEDFENGVENPRLYMSTGQRYYRRLAGEVEARNASRRAEMTDEERSNSLGSETEDVSREDQIFLYGDKGASESREEEDKALFTKAKERFGTTNDLREAGYILPDGTMLDFSGRHQMDEGADTSGLRGRRGVDHRDIKQLKYEKDGNTPSGMDVSMEDFIERGAIRIDGQYGSINLSWKPTAAQERVLRRLISRNDGYVTVEIGNGYDSEHYGEYDEGTRASKVLGDINRYFDDGMLFRFSDSTEEFDSTRDRAVEENGIVMPGLNERSVEVVPIEKMEDGRLHPFDLSLPETQKKRTIEKYAVEHGLTGDANVEGGKVNVSKRSIGLFVDDKHIQKSVKNGVPADVHVSVILKMKDVLEKSADVEIYPDRNVKNPDGTRNINKGYARNTVMHVFYGATNIDGKDYSVRTLIKEQRGKGSNSAYIYSLEEIELSDGHNEAAQSELTRKSDRTIPLSKILEKVEKTLDPEKNLLEESAKLDEQNNNGEGQDNVIGRDAADAGETPVRWVRPGEWKKKVYALDDVKLRIRKLNEQMRSAGSKEERDRLFDERSRLIGERQRIEKELDGIRPLRSDRQARESAERQWRRAHERGAELVEKLGLGDTVTMVDSIDELEGSERFGPRRRMAKGWYDPKTGKIVVVMGNHKGPQDVVQTILHEGVAHHGLRKLFGSRFDTFLDNVYENAADDIRKEIDAMAGRQGMDVRKATEEYLAKLAEDTDFDRAMDSGWWKQVKGWFLEMLRELGLDDFFGYDNLTDNELRYILWRSWKNLSEPDAYQNVFGGAEDVALQYKLNVGNYGKNAGGDNLIENRIPKMTINHGDDMQIRKMVSELSEQELRAAFNRVNDLMRDEEGLDPDEQEEAMRRALFMDNLRNGRPRAFGLGKAEMALIDRQTDKYGSGMVTLRYELMSRLEKMKEGVLFRDGDEEAPSGTGGTDPDAEGYDAGSMSLDEQIAKGMADLARKNKDNVQLRVRAMQTIGGNLQKLRQAMALQREYDRKTVDGIVRLSRLMMGSGIYTGFSPYEVSRLMGMVNRAAGREDITKEADKVVDLMVDHQLKELDTLFRKQLRTKASKLNSSGVEVQAGLDIAGQRMMTAMRESMDMGKQAFADYAAGVQDRMASEDGVTASNAAQEWQGVQLAQQYRDEIRDSKDEEIRLRQDLRDAEEALKAQVAAAQQLGTDAARLRQAHKEFVKENLQTIRENKLARTEAYMRMMEALGGNINASRERAKQWRDNEQARVNEIRHNANSDLKGVPVSAHSKPTKAMRKMNNVVLRGLASPLATFDYMLRFMGQRSVDGRGYLWNRFMTQFMDATDSEWRNKEAAHRELDAKASEVMGKDILWKELFSIERDMPGMDVEFWDNGELVTHTLTQGNLLYIYMVNKMADGRMKLRRMGITEEDVQAIKEHIDPRFVQLGDWLQDIYLKDKRKAYNEVHERMFGAPMAAIEDYFPLKINARSRAEDIDLNNEGYDHEDRLGSTITGAIVKRVKNAQALDITNADAFDVVLEHIENMEHWRAFAEMNRDLGTLLSYRNFRNKVMNMGSWRFGSGKKLWNQFQKTCAIATGAYRPKVNSKGVDKAVTNIAKGVSAAKVSMRFFTALKQLTSYPAYFSEASAVELAKSSNPKGMMESWKWAMENLPGFSKRWKIRQAGDTRLMETESDWDFWKRETVEKLSRAGMWSNAFVDAVTVAIGSKAVYETKLKGYLKDGWNPDKAKGMARRDAFMCYNETQQSSESAFTSAIQLDRTVASNGLSIFRNSPMGYERRYAQAASNLRRKMRKGYKEESVDFMAKQMERDGLSEEQARKAAERAYNRSWWKDLADLSIFGYGLQFTWALAPGMAYLAFGDDDDKKKDILKEAALTAFTGGVEGLAGGNFIADQVNGIRKGENSYGESMHFLPLLSDIETTLNRLKQDPVRGMNDIVNLGVQSGFGVNPQTVTDWAVGLLDACNGDFGLAKETGFFLMRFLSIPQNQLDEIYLDELGMNAREASQMDVKRLARRYAQYKTRRDAPLTGWMRSDASRDDAEGKYVDKFMKKYKERLMQGGDPDANATVDEYKDGEHGDSQKVMERINRAKKENPQAFHQMIQEFSGTQQYVRYRDYERYKALIDKNVKAGNYENADKLRATLANRLRNSYRKEEAGNK